MGENKRLRELVRRLDGDKLIMKIEACETIAVSSITADSRQVNEGTLFICKGFGFKKDYLLSAVEKGAVCCLSEEFYEDVDIPCIQVRDVRKASSLEHGGFMMSRRHR